MINDEAQRTMLSWNSTLPLTLATAVGWLFIGPASPSFAEDATAAPVKYEADWESLDRRPNPEWWGEAKFGIFIHWGTYSVPSWGAKGSYAEWYWHRLMRKNSPTRKFHDENYGKDFPYHQFAPMFRAELFDPQQWAEIFKRSGAKYVVLTSKHHEGFCLWPNEHASKVWGRPWNAVETGPRRDVLGDLTAAVRAQGLRMGYYYSLYEWYNPLWLSDRQKYVDEYMIPQFKELVTKYRPAVIFSDGEWDMPDKNWRSEEILAWLYNDAACRDEVVVNDRWGKGCRHKHGGYYTTEYGAGLPNAENPWEENRGMGHSYGYNRNEDLAEYRTGKELVWMLADLVSRGGNLLLNVGPTGDGRIPTIQEALLQEMGDWLAVNGEAIYGTTTYASTCQWSAGTVPEGKYKQYMSGYDVVKVVGLEPVEGIARKQVLFTAKPGVLYAIMPVWPGNELLVKGLRPLAGAKATLLGRDGELTYRSTNEGLRVELPTLNPGDLPCDHAWTVKIDGIQD